MTKRRIVRRRRDPAQEHIILVGAPSNSFNGYFHHDLNGNDVGEPPPVSTSPAQIERYMRGDPAHREDDDPERTGTHDLYWANFIYSAVKLVESGLVRPARGDILTYMLWMPGLTDRMLVDWRASPYNVALHSSSTFLASPHPPYDRRFRAADQGQWASSSQWWLPTRPPLAFATDETDIDHEILMRSTDEQGHDGGFHKRAHDAADYQRAIADIPRRLVLGSKLSPAPLPVTRVVPLMPEVQVKLLLVTDEAQFFDYIQTGYWENDVRWMHATEVHDEEQIALLSTMEESGWASFALTRSGASLPDWLSAPSVDRSRVKIRRFDYFGHSSYDAFFLSYGVSNAKGQTPTSERWITSAEWETHLQPDLFVPGASAKLWGCYLGVTMAPMLSQFFGNVVACESWTTFDSILNDGQRMPEPDPTSSGFQTYVGGP